MGLDHDVIAKIGWQNAAGRAEKAADRAERAAARLEEALSWSGRRRWRLINELAEARGERDQLYRILNQAQDELAATRSVLAMLLPDKHGHHHCLGKDADPWTWVQVGMDFTEWPTVRAVNDAERAALDALETTDA